MKLKYHPYISKRERRYLKTLHETCFVCYESDTNNLLTNICNCKSYIHDYCLAIVIINMGMRCRTCNEVYFSQKHNIKKRKTKIMKLLRLYYIEEVENKKSNWDRFDEFIPKGRAVNVPIRNDAPISREQCPTTDDQKEEMSK